MFDARNSGRELEKEGKDILTSAAKHSPELAIAMETWKEIKFPIVLFTLNSSSVSQSLSFNLPQSLYCPLSSVLALCLQIKVWSFSVLSIRIDSGSLFSS